MPAGRVPSHPLLHAGPNLWRVREEHVPCDDRPGRHQAWHAVDLGCQRCRLAAARTILMAQLHPRRLESRHKMVDWWIGRLYGPALFGSKICPTKARASQNYGMPNLVAKILVRNLVQCLVGCQTATAKILDIDWFVAHIQLSTKHIHLSKAVCVTQASRGEGAKIPGEGNSAKVQAPDVSYTPLNWLEASACQNLGFKPNECQRFGIVVVLVGHILEGNQAGPIIFKGLRANKIVRVFWVFIKLLYSFSVQ